MTSELESACDAVIAKVTAGYGAECVPGVVAMITDRNGDLWQGCGGVRSIGTGHAMDSDSVFALFSTTKAIAGVAVLQCYEEGLLDLDAPAHKYAPELAKIQVLDGFDSNGAPQLRPPKRDITTRMLMLHTAGFGYDMFNETLFKLSHDQNLPGVIEATHESLMWPLLFDPDEDWEYGMSTDWCGQVVEGIRQKRLSDVLSERVFAPIGMDNTAFSLSPSMKTKRTSMHMRGDDGSLKELPNFALPDNPQVDMAGHGLYGTVGDYTKFIRMWLNNGRSSGGQILQPDTVDMAMQSGLRPHQKVRTLPGVNRTVSNDVNFFPGVEKSWGYTFMINEEETPTGRPAGSAGWAGLANVYFWIDRRNGLGGMWATQVLPFIDAVSFEGFMDLETMVYRHHR